VFEENANVMNNLDVNALPKPIKKLPTHRATKGSLSFLQNQVWDHTLSHKNTAQSIVPSVPSSLWPSTFSFISCVDFALTTPNSNVSGRFLFH
jgi:hypothetical protein